MDTLSQAAEVMSSADAMVIGAGAGMSVDSGLPDFRGPQGFWRAYPPFARLGLSFVDLANPRWFRDDPSLAWGFYGHRLALYRRTSPHEGYGVLLNWAKLLPAGMFVFTSNVDNHFHKAGFESSRIVECHGSIEFLQCSEGCCRAIWAMPAEGVVVDEESMRALPPLPQCPHCGAVARPNILMFNDWTWISDRTDSQQQRFAQWLRGIAFAKAKLVVLEIGAGTAVPSVRMTCETLAHTYGATLVRINPHEPGGDAPCLSIPGTALSTLRQLAKRVRFA